MTWLLPLAASAFCFWTVMVPALTGERNALQPGYADGAVSHYEMKGENDGWRYTIRAAAVAKRDARGRSYLEIRWSDLTSNAGQTLAPADLAFRQTVSLDDPFTYMRVPDLSTVQPALIGPITDTLTFYSDLLLAMRAKLSQAGQSALIARSTPNAWADGQRVLLGQDVVDFSLRVEAVDTAKHTETLVVQHVPPREQHVNLPAPWMRTSVAGVPNFVQVMRDGDHFTADVGRETFEVRLVVDTRDGRLLSAFMHNPVAITSRKCNDRELMHCGDAVQKITIRKVNLQLVP